MKKQLLSFFAIVLITLAQAINAQPITIVGHSSKFSSGSSVMVNVPDSIQPGDFLLAHISFRPGAGFGIKTDSVWIKIRGINGGSNGVGTVIFYKIASSSEPSSYVFSDTAGVSSSDKLGIISAYRGVDTLNPIDSEKGIGLTSSPYSTPDDTTTTDSCMIVTLFTTRNVGTSSWTPPAGMTEGYDTSGTQSTRITSCGDYVIQPLAGSTGQKTAIPSGGSGNVAAEIIALRPASIATNVSSDNGLSFNIYPNPAANDLWIASRGLLANGGTVNIEINNILGKKVYSHQYELRTNDHNLNVDVSSLAKGIYLVQIQSTNERRIVRFVKE